MASLSKTFDFSLRRDHKKKKSYERRDYESVDGHVPKNYEKKNSGSKELTITDITGMCFFAQTINLKYPT